MQQHVEVGGEADILGACPTHVAYDEMNPELARLFDYFDDEEDEPAGWVGYSPSRPGCWSQGATLAEAEANLLEAMAAWDAADAAPEREGFRMRLGDQQQRGNWEQPREQRCPNDLRAGRAGS